MSNKLNIGELVASEMESLMASEEYRSLFKPSLTVTAAAKKKDEKEADKKKKCKCPPKCKCPGSKGEKCKCKAHRKEAMVEEVAETLAKVSEQLDEINLSKTATAALQLITSLVAEAMDGCEVDDGDTAAADDGEEDSGAADDGKDEDGDDNEARVDPGSSIDVGLSSLDEGSELDKLISDQKSDMDSEEYLENHPDEELFEHKADEDEEDEEEDMDEYSLLGDDGEEVGEGERALFSELEGLEDEDYSDDGLMASAASKDKDKEKAKKEKEKAKAQALKEKEKAAKEKAKEKAAKEKEKEKAAKEKEKAKKEKK